MVATAERTITSPIPLRLIALHGRSAYSGLMNGLRPFDVSLDPIDRVRAEIMVERKPVLSDLPMDAPEAAQQIVNGIYQLEGGAWRWTSQSAVVLLKPPTEPTPLVVQFSIPDQSPARHISLSMNGQQMASQTFAGPGKYSLTSPPAKPDGDSVQVTVSADKSFFVQGDSRQLAIILLRVGFEKP